MWKKRAWLIFLVVSTLVVGQTTVAVGNNDRNGDLVDDALTVSVAAAGDQSFPETDVPITPTASVINFDNLGTMAQDGRSGTCGSTSAYTNGTQIQAIGVSDGVARNIGTGSGTLICHVAWQYGGAGGTGFHPYPGGTEASAWVIRFNETQRYVGFWWSGGNDENYIQLVSGTTNRLSPHFSAKALYRTLFESQRNVSNPQRDCGPSNNVHPYCGNPNLTIMGTTFPTRREPTETFAFVHLRFPEGFNEIKIYGGGFEFDNLTVSQTVPDLGAEEDVVGALPAYSLTAARVIPVDPRSQSVPFPGVLLAGAASTQPNATLCLTQVSNSSGTQVYSGSSGIQVSVPATMGITQSLSPPRFTFTGSQTTVRNLSNQIRIISSTTSRTVASSETVWLRASVQAALNAGDLSCSSSNNVITAFVIELRPIRLNSVNQLGIPID
jgi:hypothetical protein